jgi:cysteinyl-tRNA synthetase
MSPLQLYTTRTRAKQTFVPADPSGWVALFVCGPTIYDLLDRGHAGPYTQFDFVSRLPRTRGFAVRYVQNVTVVDDKIIRRARCGSTRPSSRACTRARIWTARGRAGPRRTLGCPVPSCGTRRRSAHIRDASG